MQHAAAVVVTWLLGIVAAVGLVAGAPAAARIAGNSMGTIGITAGAVLGGFDEATSGFQAARTAADRSGMAQKPTANRGGGSNRGAAARPAPRNQQRQAAPRGGVIAGGR
jgi:hypothetical protein